MLFVQLLKYSIPMEIHPRMAWIYQIAEICQRWGGVGVRGVRGMDAAANCRNGMACSWWVSTLVDT